MSTPKEVMGRAAVLIVVTAILAACGGRPQPSAAPPGFVNRTRHSDAELQSIWATAQQSLAQSIDLNPLQPPKPTVPPRILPGDPRALIVAPHQLLVAAEPDASAEDLFAATGVQRTDPTGMIACPKPCNVSYATAYSRYQPDLTKYAASWEFDGDNFEVILEYEFENQILKTLGYDMKWR